MMEVMEDREVWRLHLELLPRNLHGKAGNEERKKRRRRKPIQCKSTTAMEVKKHGKVLWLNTEKQRMKI